MKGKVAVAWDAVKLFCVTQAQNFYVGIALSALIFLAFVQGLPILSAAAILPLSTVAIYTLMRPVLGGTLEFSGDYGLGKSMLAIALSSMYTLLLAFI